MNITNIEKIYLLIVCDFQHLNPRFKSISRDSPILFILEILDFAEILDFPEDRFSKNTI